MNQNNSPTLAQFLETINKVYDLIAKDAVELKNLTEKFYKDPLSKEGNDIALRIALISTSMKECIATVSLLQGIEMANIYCNNQESLKNPEINKNTKKNMENDSFGA